MARPHHVILGSGTAGFNAISTLAELEGTPLNVTLVSAERPYARMVLPYYLSSEIQRDNVFTITPERLAALREGFEATLRDGAFREDARKQELNVVPVSGKEMHEVIAKAYSMPGARSRCHCSRAASGSSPRRAGPRCATWCASSRAAFPTSISRSFPCGSKAKAPLRKSLRR